MDNSTIANIIGVRERTGRRVRARFMANESMTHKSRGTPANKIHTAIFIDSMKIMVEENPTIGIQEAACLTGVGTMTMNRAIQDDLQHQICLSTRLCAWSCSQHGSKLDDIESGFLAKRLVAVLQSGFKSP